MTISPSLAAVAGAAVVALIVAFVLRPAQLTPHAPAPEFSAAAESVRPAPADRTPLLVYVAGAVVHPGVYGLSSDARARDALAKAGGAARDANLLAVNLAAHITDGEEIAVPRFGDVTANTIVRSARGRKPSAGARHTRRPPPATSQVDLNSADAQALSALPGIGSTLAARIVEFRTLNGPFASVDGLADVSGMTQQRLDALTPYLTAGR